MAQLHTQEIASIIAADQEQQAMPNTLIEHLLLDSRSIKFPKSSLFFAIKGQQHNGHGYLKNAHDKGVRYFVVSEPWVMDTEWGKESHFILVQDTVEALQKLAAHIRQAQTFPVVGITGSNGKTTVKEWLYQLLKTEKHIVRSPKSYNSQVGVPLSVWQIAAEHNLGIFEAGISEMGEMAKLESVLCPDIGIFTNIGAAHSEGFKNEQQKADEKIQLFAHSKWLIYRADYEVIEKAIQKKQRQAKKKGETTYSFEQLSWTYHAKQMTTKGKKRPKSKTKATLQINTVERKGNKTIMKGRFKDKAVGIISPFTDEAAFENVVHCWLLLLHWEYDSMTISVRMQQLQKVAMRLELKQGLNNCSVVSDCYNADLNALGIALDFLEHQGQHQKKTVILSDFLQSGQNDLDLYQTVANLLAEKKIQRLIGIGSQIGRFKHLFSDLETTYYPTTQAFLSQPPVFKEEVILVKGARPFALESVVKSLEHKVHNTVLEINLNAIAHNLKVYRELLESKTKVMAMVKAFSYGSGSFEIANLLQFNNVDYLGVAYVDEGVALRKAGIKTPILVLNPEMEAFDNLLKFDLEPEIYSLYHLNQYLNYLKQPSQAKYKAQGARIHLKIDTGMRRLGFEANTIAALIQTLRANDFLRVKTIFSHLAASEAAEHDAFTQTQIAQFQTMFHQIQSVLGYPIDRHILNSAGIVRFPQQQMEMVRLGLGLYGIDSSQTLQHRLQTTSQLKTYISQLKKVPANETVGYGRSGKAAQDSLVATVAIGYGDGVPRALSNGNGGMLVNGVFAPILGNVCMDMCMLDVSHLAGVVVGDEVIVFGDAALSVEQMAANANTIAYEILTGISNRVKRVYFQE